MCTVLHNANRDCGRIEHHDGAAHGTNVHHDGAEVVIAVPGPLVSHLANLASHAKAAIGDADWPVLAGLIPVNAVQSLRRDPNKF